MTHFVLFSPYMYMHMLAHKVAATIDLKQL